MQGEDCITVLIGETPIMKMGYSDQEVTLKAVNFLRSGCPSVQFVADNDINHSTNEFWFKKMKESLDELSLPGEKFFFDKDYDEASPQSVLLLTRQKN